MTALSEQIQHLWHSDFAAYRWWRDSAGALKGELVAKWWYEGLVEVIKESAKRDCVYLEEEH